MITKDPKMREMVKRYFEPTDYFEVRNHMVGTGIIGGKACGMLLARKMIQLQQPEVYKHLEPHDSFYLGSDVFYSYLVANDLWTIRIKQRSEEGFIDEAPALKEGLLNGSFPDDIRERFMRILDYYGQAPIIVRSSSFLEDASVTPLPENTIRFFAPTWDRLKSDLMHSNRQYAVSTRPL